MILISKLRIRIHSKFSGPGLETIDYSIPTVSYPGLKESYYQYWRQISTVKFGMLGQKTNCVIRSIYVVIYQI